MSAEEDSKPRLLTGQRIEPDAELDQLARAVIGAAIEVHRQLGPGLLEEVYERALYIEFQLRGIEFRQQRNIGVTYKGHPVAKAVLIFSLEGGSWLSLSLLSDLHRFIRPN